MSMRRTLSGFLSTISLLIMSACQTTAAEIPAVLSSADSENMTNLKSTLSQALKKKNIQLGAGDPTQHPVVTVLPKAPGPYDTMSPALPITFDIMKRGSICMLVRRDTQEEFVLNNVNCTIYQDLN